jgi:hypothetical protein
MYHNSCQNKQLKMYFNTPKTMENINKIYIYNVTHMTPLGNGSVNTFSKLRCQQQKKTWRPEKSNKNSRPLLGNGLIEHGCHGIKHVSDTTHT